MHAHYSGNKCNTPVYTSRNTRISRYEFFYKRKYN